MRGEDGMFDKKETVVLTVAGMSCGHCQKRVADTLSGMKGVKKAAVDLANGTATVEFVPAKVTAEQLAQAVTEVGFTVTDTRLA